MSVSLQGLSSFLIAIEIPSFVHDVAAIDQEACAELSLSFFLVQLVQPMTNIFFPAATVPACVAATHQLIVSSRRKAVLYAAGCVADFVGAVFALRCVHFMKLT